MAGGQQDSADFQQLVIRRRKFIDGLDANKGEINLDIFEDFYPDKAHFVYELLQNAEDAGATEVAFTLMPDRLVCAHDGRAFTLEDVTSITGLHDSTKAKAPDKIGKFGVGFKSVFVYTQAPAIRSGDFAFRIVKLILPEPIATDPSLGRRTLFEFPFDNAKKTAKDAHAEIAEGLNDLDEKTLLFLSNLQSIKWCIGDDTGEVLRLQHSDFHFEVLKEVGGKTTASSHFLKFDEAVPGLGKLRVAVAFPLDALPGVRRFERATPLAEQFKIIPASPGSVAVFFPAAKESSGLRFHLHGPFVPELSRASIKDTEANLPLFKQLATLAAQSLHQVKKLGLLTAEYLAVLPNPQDQISPRYAGIRNAIVEEMKSRPLVPTHHRGYAPAKRLIQAKASLKSLLSEDDVKFLVDYVKEPPLWSIGATQRNSRIDHFLAGLDIQEWGLNKFLDVLNKRVRDEVGMFKPDEKFLTWLRQKPAAWMQECYALLQAEAENYYQLKNLRIVRLSDGNLSRADQAFFASLTSGNGLAVVDSATYTTGTAKKQQEDAKTFLSRIGVREVGEVEEIEIILKSRYTKKAEITDYAVYLGDLRRFIALLEKRSDKAKLFADYYIFQGKSGDWHCPKNVYLDKPYLDTDLSAYCGALPPEGQPEALHDRYKDCGIEVEQFGKFAKAVGARVGLDIIECTIRNNPERSYLVAVNGTRASSVINRDYHIPKLVDLLKTPSLKLSRLIWRALMRLPVYPDYLRATYQLNKANGARYAASLLVHELRAASWIPQGDSRFVRPTDAARELLPKGFPFDSGDAWIKAIQFGESVVKASAQAFQRDVAAKSLGFVNAEAADRAKRLINELPEEQLEALLAELENPREKGAVPDRTLTNPARRTQNTHEQALNAPDKETEIREHSVPIGRKNVKEQAKSFLREHYRNANADMTCQICKRPLPFNMDDGEGHFETVAFLPELTKEHSQNYLALCPNHAAMYQLVNGSRKTMRKAFLAIEGNELPVVLAEKDMTIYFSKTHIIDLKAVLNAEDDLDSAPDKVLADHA